MSKYSEIIKVKASNKELINRYKEYKNRAIRNNIEFSINLSVFVSMVSDNCYICETLPEKMNGIDRIDNDQGYTFNNSIGCCWNCNRAKNDMSINEFEKWLTNMNPEKAKIFKEVNEKRILKNKFNTASLSEAMNHEQNNILFDTMEKYIPKIGEITKVNVFTYPIYIHKFILKNNYFFLASQDENDVKISDKIMKYIKEDALSKRKKIKVRFYNCTNIYGLEKIIKPVLLKPEQIFDESCRNLNLPLL